MAGIELKQQGVYNFTSNSGGTKLTLNYGTSFPFGVIAHADSVIEGNLEVDGDMEAGGDVVAFSTSDQRLKDNIFIIEDPLQKINALRGITFKWNNKAPRKKSGNDDIGVIAQEVQKVLPNAVRQREGEEKYLAVDYDKLVPLLIEGIKSLNKKIEILETKIDKGEK